MMWEPEGAYWHEASLVWGQPAGNGSSQLSVSPLGHDLQAVKTLSEDEVTRLFEPASFESYSLAPAVIQLKELLVLHRPALLRDLRNTTGFTPIDCEETLDGCISLLDRFATGVDGAAEEFVHEGRRIGLRRVPWGTIVAVLPQNAFLIMGLTILLNALAAGNRVVLRAPSGSYRLAAILAGLLVEAGFDPNSFSVILCDASQLVKAWEKATHPMLLHYMGSSGRGGELLAKSFNAGQPCLIDGEGNTYVYIDEDQDPVASAEIVWKGAIRYNGQTCTSINGAVVHPAIETPFRIRLRDLVVATSFGLSESDDVGPLFTSGQAEGAERVVQNSSGRIGRCGIPQGNLCPPTIVEDPAVDSDLVREGLFAPVTWIRTGDFQEFGRLWRANRYPLCAGVLSDSQSVAEQSMALPGLSRIVMNGDPSLEDVMEPWGGYPSCGSNPVSSWYEKYRRTVQLDQRT